MLASIHPESRYGGIENHREPVLLDYETKFPYITMQTHVFESMRANSFGLASICQECLKRNALLRFMTNKGQ